MIVEILSVGYVGQEQLNNSGKTKGKTTPADDRHTQGRRHTFLAGGTRISAVSFGSDQWNGMCFYGTDKYVNWLRSV